MTNQITEVRLLSVPLGKDYKNTLYFADKTAQYNYFYGNTKHSIVDSSYQRKEGYIRFPEHIEELSGCNYLMYNNGFTGSWVYAFITEMVYKSDEVTWIYFEVDVLQTYMFDYQIKPSFVEREHCADDTFGKHTLPENLECGEFVCEHEDQVTELADSAYVVATTEKWSDNSDEWQATSGNRYDGIFSGVSYSAFNTSEMGKLYSFIEKYNNGKTDSITSIFMYPYALLSLTTDNGVFGQENPHSLSKVFTRGAFEGFTPRNNKLYTFPYHYLLVSNNNGGSAVYQFEHFKDNTTEFKIYGCLTPGGSIRMVPMNYKNQDENHEEGLNLGKYPICNWSSDEYTNWLTQNSVNIGLNIAAGVGQIIGGVAMAGGTGGLGLGVGGGVVAGGVSTIAGQLAQIHQMSFASPQSRGNINCGDVVASTKKNTFFFYQMRIKEEYMRIIDNFFDMFGYKTNRVKVPETNHRENYWYTKTIDVNIVQKDGRSVPQGDLDKIKECFNRGVTFWRSGASVGNYEISNKPLTEV